MPVPPTRISKSHYELLSSLRYALRRFTHFSEVAARRAGVTPQQHQALLTIKGFPGRDHASIGELAERLRVRPHSAVGLVDRLVRLGLVKREASTVDLRRVEIRLTARGEGLLRRLSTVHLRELRQLGPELHQLLGSLIQA